MISGNLQRLRYAAKLVGICVVLGVFMSSSGAQTDSDNQSRVKNISVVLKGVEKELRTNVEGMLGLWAFHEKKIPSVARMRFMHSEAPQQIKDALKPFGYYRATVKAELTDQGSEWRAEYEITPGDRVKVTSEPVIALDDVVVDCTDFRYQPYNPKSLLPDIKVEDDTFNKHKALVIEFCEARDEAALRKGEPLDQQAYDSLKQTLQTTAGRLGYFDAEFTKHEIRIDIKAYTAEIMLVMKPGERYRIGEAILTEDRRWISDDLLDRYVELEDQEFFDAGKLQSLQSDLTNSEYYKQVDVQASVQEAEELVIPVKVDLTHIKPREYILGLGYGTDTGARGRLGITGRRVNTRGHQYNAEGRLSEIGYGVAAEYTIPTGDPRTDNYGVNVLLERENSDRGDYRSIALGANYNFRDGFWFKTYALQYEVNQFEVTGDNQTTTSLLMPSLEWTRTFPAELEKRIFAINGSWLQLGLRGAAESLLSDTSFVQPRISAKVINSFENQHRLLLRATAATTWVDDFDQLPLSLRYYTGGDTSVRGYDFAAIAPLNEENETDGGKHLLEASVEYEIPFRENFSWAVFSDYGDAFNSGLDLRLGVGAGVR